MENFTVNEISRNINPIFGLEQILYKITYPDNPQTFEDALEQVEDMLRELAVRFTSDMRIRDKIRVVFNHADFMTCIDLPFLRRDQFTPELLIESFENVIQSYKESIVNRFNRFSAQVQIQRMPSGRGRRFNPNKLPRKHKYVPKVKLNKNVINPTTLPEIQNICNNKNSIINVFNDDNFCLLRAILIGMRYSDNSPDKASYSKPNNAQIESDVRYFKKTLNLPNDGCGLGEVKQIEAYIENYCISIIDGTTHKSSNFLYKGLKNKKFIYLLYTNSHYNVISSMPAFLERSYYCNFCNMGYSNATVHNCKEMCKSCKKFECNPLANHPEIKCSKCKVTANSDLCLKRHNDIICDKRVICDKCNYIKSNRHVCTDQKYCTKCKKVVNLDHRCYITTDETKDGAFEGYIFFDYEAFQENGIHIPNLIIAYKVCKNCIDTGNMCNDFCEIFRVDNNNEFCTWLFKQKDFIAIGHNARGYDSIFINQWINESLEFFDKSPNFIRVGSKILSIEFRSVKIICSLSFLPMPLEKFAKTFDLKESKKGFFPHLFNTRENQKYIGEYPAKEFYQPNFMSDSKKNEFDEWYSKVFYKKDGSKTIFNFQNEIISYCESDVDILMKGCLAFRKIIMDQTEGIDPFRKSITIASLCHYIYRTKLMEPNTIAILPDQGYNLNEKTSKKAILWLKYVAEKNNIFLQHAKNMGEFKVGNFQVDGYDAQTNTAYEFFGCVWHGHLACNKPDTFIPFLQKTIAGINMKHTHRLSEIKKSVNVVEMWECEWDRLCKEDDSIREFCKYNHYKPPLNPRDGFFGGRTEAFSLYATNIKAKYYDYTSLYPDRQKYSKYPVGHPTIITENFSDVFEYFGFIMCKILPPNKLYFPVLPARINGKLLFTLCSTCGANKCRECTHSDEEKCLDGTWVTLEIQQAIKQGYKILKIYEVWHFEESSVYDKETKSGGLFTSYIDMFLKGKQEASGWPSDVNTEEEKENYINEYYKNEGIKLDKSKIKLNEGLRSICKLLLNSHWGRFAMATNKSQYKLITDPVEWLNLIADDQYIVQSVDFTHKNFLQVYFINSTKTFESNANVNVALAAFVTCHARLKLLEEITKIGDRVLYVDTDSMIFKSVINMYEPITGKNLGQLTDEIKDGKYIVEYVSAGPKNYAYKKDNGETNALVKGFALNHTTAKSINFESIKDIVTNDQSKKIITEQLKFSRDKVNWTNSTSIIKKTYRLVYDKRILNEDFTTLPFGWRN